jgi:hypothetical protein
MPRGRVLRAGVEEALVAGVLVVVDTPVAGVAGPDQLEVEPGSVAVELASVERASPVEAGASQADLACRRSDRTSFRDPSG